MFFITDKKKFEGRDPMTKTGLGPTKENGWCWFRGALNIFMRQNVKYYSKSSFIIITII